MSQWPHGLEDSPFRDEPGVPQQGPQQDGLEERERANFLLQIRVLKAIVEREGDPDKLACLASDIEQWRVETQTALRNLRGMNKRVQREIRLREQVERKLAALSASRTTQQDALTVQDWLTLDRIEQTLTTIGAITIDDAKWLIEQLTKLGRAVYRLSASRIDPPVPSPDGQERVRAFNDRGEPIIHEAAVLSSSVATQCPTCQGRRWVMRSSHRDLGGGLGAGGSWNEACPDCTASSASAEADTQKKNTTSR